MSVFNTNLFGGMLATFCALFCGVRGELGALFRGVDVRLGISFWEEEVKLSNLSLVGEDEFKISAYISPPVRKKHTAVVSVIAKLQ